MQAAPCIKTKLSRQVLPIFKLSPLCLCLLLSACQKQDEATSPTSSTAKIELIAQDLVQFQEGLLSNVQLLLAPFEPSIKVPFRLK